MAVVRVEKSKNYTCMSNHHLRNKELSLAACGLLSRVLSLPDDWNYSKAGLTSICKEGKTAVDSALKDLQRCGYLSIKKLMPNETKSGRIEYEYTFYETPKQGSCSQGLEKQGIEILGLEFKALETSCNKILTSNTKESNTEDCSVAADGDEVGGSLNPEKSLITKKENKDKSRGAAAQHAQSRFIVPTVEEVQAYARETGKPDHSEQFWCYYESIGWKVGKKPMKSWKAAYAGWCSRQKQYGSSASAQQSKKGGSALAAPSKTKEETNAYIEQCNDFIKRISDERQRRLAEDARQVQIFGGVVSGSVEGR